MRALVVGSSGALGSAIVADLRTAGWHVVGAGRSAKPGTDIVLTEDAPWTSAVDAPFEGVVMAQGMNARGSVDTASPEDMAGLYDANVVSIVRTLRALLDARLLASGGAVVILSSVWQVTARADKLAYVASKAAVGGLVPALAADLAGRARVNAVLPGVIDTPMTRAQLTPAQVASIEEATPGGALASPGDVAGAVRFLLEPGSRGLNGQSLIVDNGWSGVRYV